MILFMEEVEMTMFLQRIPSHRVRVVIKTRAASTVHNVMDWVVYKCIE